MFFAILRILLAIIGAAFAVIGLVAFTQIEAGFNVATALSMASLIGGGYLTFEAFRGEKGNIVNGLQQFFSNFFAGL